MATQAGDAQLSVSVRQNQVLFVLGRVILSSRLIDGQFPNYRQLLPESFDHELRVSGPELTDVVRGFDAWATRELAGINAALRSKKLEPITVLSRQQWEAAAQ